MSTTGPDQPPCFDARCRQCPRLARWLDDVRHEHPDYHCAPVPPFGAGDAGLLVVGLAPGMHGANATGRPFTGDHAGMLLYRTLHEFGFASAPESRAGDDGLELFDCRVTNAVKCLPPANKPTGAEARTCNGYLAAELDHHPPRVIIALGRVAHDAILRALGARLRDHPFVHGHEHFIHAHAPVVLDCYHCSRYNTQTRRLTEPMFRDIFRRARERLGAK
jgi:uracil-DNA glycosylase family 4